MIYTNVTRLGKFIGFRGYDEDGKRVQKQVEYFPTMYLSSSKKSKFHDIHGYPVEPIQPGVMWETKKYIEQWQDVDGFTVHGQDNWVIQFISDFYHNETHPALDFDDICIGYVDIETECEESFPDVENPRERINAITIRVKNDSYMFGLGNFTVKSTKTRNYHCFSFDDEKDLIKSFYELWAILDLDVVVGWNSEMFDIPYIVGRTAYLLGEEFSKKISPWGKIWKKSVRDDYGNMRTSYSIYGIAQLDFMKLYKKYVLTPRETYKLDYIAECEIGHNKLDWQKDHETMRDFYMNDFQTFMEYNSIDVDLISMMEDKLQLLHLQTQIAYTAMVNYEDVFSPVRTWDAIIYNHLRDQDIVIPMKENTEKNSQYAGAYVMEPKAGMYKCVASFDLASLYPNLIISRNISPDTIVLRGELEGFRKKLEMRIKEC